MCHVYSCEYLPLIERQSCLPSDQHHVCCRNTTTTSRIRWVKWDKCPTSSVRLSSVSTKHIKAAVSVTVICSDIIRLYCLNCDLVHCQRVQTSAKCYSTLVVPTVQFPRSAILTFQQYFPSRHIIRVIQPTQLYFDTFAAEQLDC